MAALAKQYPNHMADDPEEYEKLWNQIKEHPQEAVGTKLTNLLITE